MARKHKSGNGLDRRTFLKTGAASALLLGGGRTAAWADTNGGGGSPRGMARSVICFVSDGMSAGTLSMADHLLQRRDGKQSNWMKLYERTDIHRGLMDMASANSIVTDSAAAAASWGSGRRYTSGSLNVGPDGEEHMPILYYAKEAGKSTGLVTTTEVTHATPAGFGAIVPSRGMQEKIAEQYLDFEWDVILGGGSDHFNPMEREDGRDLYAAFREKGYEIAETRDELLEKDPGNPNVLGTFWPGHVPYTLDHINSSRLKERVPTLAEMTDDALRRLSQNPNGFIMQVEGGRVDHAAHGNDLGGLLYDQIAFDEAIGVALKFQEENPDVLILITTDHGNANPGLSSHGGGHNGGEADFDRVFHLKQTNDWIRGQLSEDSSVQEIKDLHAEAWGFEITGEEAQGLQKRARGEYDPLYHRFGDVRVAQGHVLANYTGVNWVGTQHTSDYVELCGVGPGSHGIRPFIKNYELFNIMLDAVGVDYAQEARKQRVYV